MAHLEQALLKECEKSQSLMEEISRMNERAKTEEEHKKRCHLEDVARARKEVAKEIAESTKDDILTLETIVREQVQNLETCAHDKDKLQEILNMERVANQVEF